MARFLQVGLFTPGTPGFFSDVLMGVQEFARGKWCVETHGRVDEAEEITRAWKPHGLLLSTYGGDWGPLIRRLNVPTVLIGGDALPQYPRILTDDAAIGRMAAEYYLDRGFRNYAFCGYDQAWSIRREEAFRGVLAAKGFACRAFRGRGGEIHTANVMTILVDWLKQLPRPVAVFACHDRIAMLLGHACGACGLAVPDAVAILGVDNNPLETGFTLPPISSIVGSARRVGYEAAELLQHLMQGKRPPARPILVAPASVQERASTNVYACQDQEVVAALRFIRTHAHEPIHVGDVATAVIVTRRMLERKFRNTLNSSPHEQIVKAHIDRAKELLIKTDFPTLNVALQSGFRSASKLSDTFKRETGLAPTAFRRLYGSFRSGH